MAGKRASKLCPLFKQTTGFDFDKDGNLYLPVGKKVCLNASCTIYLVSAGDASTVDFYIGSARKGEISADGFSAVP